MNEAERAADATRADRSAFAQLGKELGGEPWFAGLVGTSTLPISQILCERREGFLDAETRAGGGYFFTELKKSFCWAGTELSL